MASKKHADLIRAWLDGALIQYKVATTGLWQDFLNPTWAEETEYRIKPAEPERVYPLSKLSGSDIEDFVDSRSKLKTTYAQDLHLAANYVLKHACDSGQIVTREEFDKLHAEFDRAVGDRKARDLQIAYAVLERAYVAVMRCDSGLEGAVVRQVNIEKIIAELK